MQHTSTYAYEHNGVKTRLTALGDGLIRISRTCRNTFLDPSSPIVTCTDRIDAELRENADTTTFSTGSLTVVITKATGTLSFHDANGTLLLTEPTRQPYLLEEKPVLLHRYDSTAAVIEREGIDGVRASASPAEIYEDRTAYEYRQSFTFDPTEALYGLGSHEEGFGNLRGRARLLYQHNMKAVVPVLVSTKGYGLLFDMGCMMSFRDDTEGSYLWADCTDEPGWYFFYGDGSYPSLMQQYRRLTGATPMLPQYALGYIQSKERYLGADDILSVAAEYRRRQIPIDMLVMDWLSWPDEQWGYKTFNKRIFPDPSGFISKLHEMDLHFMLSIWPTMRGDQNGDRKEMLENDAMLSNRLIYNAFDPKARALYWKQANEGLFCHGVDAWWCDCTEPFESDWHGTIKPEPFKRAQINTDEAKRYIDPTKINLFSLCHSQGIYEGQRSVTDKKRVCNLTRSSYAGQHRYATITWSGDVSANWETLRRHVPEGMNFCAAGEPYWTTDIGAFFPQNDGPCWFYDGDYNRGVDDLGYRELYVRWAQYATFLPLMRSHGTGTPREIWRFGEKGEPFYDALEKAIRLRYHLVPYLYTLMAETYQNGISMLRVPALVFPQDTALRRIDDQMMLGESLLVKPITHPLYYGPDSTPITDADDRVKVYLPTGHSWYDLHTAAVYPGGTTATVHAPLDTVPVFVRSGTILPWGADVQSTAQLADAPLELRIYPGESGRFTLYRDAGDGYGYESGQFEQIPFTWDDASNTLTIGKRIGSYPNMPQTLQLILHRIGTAEKTVTYFGEELQITL